MTETSILVLAAIGAGAARPAEPRPPGPPEGFYSDYDVSLRDHVDADGMLDYGALKKERARLDSFASALAALDPEAFGEWPENDRVALWLNAYNAFTLTAVIDHYPLTALKGRSPRHPKNSIRRIPGVWSKLKFRVIGRDMTLDGIEHLTLRKKFDEPRIHFALVCAAKSCPRLRRRAYVGERLDAQLDDQARHFLSRRGNFRIDRERGRVYLSSIFRWYGRDFVKKHGTQERFRRLGGPERAVLNFSLPYLAEDDRRYLLRERYSISYVAYDWSLNEQPPRKSDGETRETEKGGTQ
ncbi:MAG: DUF547 domain-containing protein [Planctomycetota bacterium]